ncbi:secreted RxLR effector protein 161-like [Solanum lycopersicum]|uniref:secreted RxLR effector protein 161-like n=1 Tax=Solanum lycopersicum TaxID=4081 RepID=UPI003749421B
MALVPYASAVGSLMYAMVYTRPDIAHAVGVVSRYMANPGKEYWEVLKWVLRYMRGTSSTSLCFGKGKMTIQDFVDSDLGGDVDSIKSTSKYIYTIGGIVVTWMYRLQKCVSLSSTEAEYVAMPESWKEMIWLADYLEELGNSRAIRFFTQIARTVSACRATARNANEASPVPDQEVSNAVFRNAIKILA